MEDRINQRHRHAITIHHGDIDRVFVHRLADRRGGGHGAFGIDQRCKGAGGLSRQHMLQPRGVIRVRQKPVARVIGKLGGLGLDMQPLGSQWVHPGDVEMIEDIHQQQGGRPLAIGWMFDHFEVFVVARHGRRDLGAGAGEILGAMAATCGLQRGDHVFGDLSGVEGIAPFRGHATQHFGLSRRAENITDAGRFTFDEEVVPRAPLKGAAVRGPVKSHARGDGHPGIGIVDRGGQQRVQPQLAEVV